MTAAVAVSAPDLFSFHPSIAPLPPPPADADGSDFEFRIPAAAAALSAADELFSGGKLVPLLPPPPAPLPSLSCSPPPCQEDPLPEPASPRAPRCAGRRWRDLLLLVTKKPKPAGEGACRTEASLGRRPLLSRDSSSSSSASSCDSGGRTARRPPPPSRSPLRTRSAPVASLLHLISNKHPADCRNGAPPRRQHQPQPLLTRVSSSSSASSSDSGRAPWHPRAPARHRPAVAAESPRVSASGRVVFRGLERCSSTPAGAGIGGGARRPRPRGMERSYSTNVRVDPVINVFGFGHLFPSSPAKEKKTDVAAAGRRNRPEKLAMVLRDPQD
ncbi:uncharacterized protein [Lolium perenne]|uniref:uncharacterized protein n=1 Tax=Lolium perenne TaxID=4522 RepID=UPI0021EA068F|nr:uncharacterized protein LOC127336144 [Lolium perenne]